MIANYGKPLKTVFSPRGAHNNTFFQMQTYAWSEHGKRWVPIAIKEYLFAREIRNPT